MKSPVQPPRLRDRQAFRVLGVHTRLDPATEDWARIWGQGFMPRAAEVRPFAVDDCVYGVFLESAVFECRMETIGATWRHVHDLWLPASPYRHHCAVAGFERYPPGAGEGGAPITIHVPIIPR
jgi:predicted transcriptional regulator YdeE